MINVIQDFVFAALPWVAMAVVVAYITASWANKDAEKDNSKG